MKIKMSEVIAQRDRPQKLYQPNKQKKDKIEGVFRQQYDSFSKK